MKGLLTVVPQSIDVWYAGPSLVILGKCTLDCNNRFIFKYMEVQHLRYPYVAIIKLSQSLCQAQHIYIGEKLTTIGEGELGVVIRSLSELLNRMLTNKS